MDLGVVVQPLFLLYFLAPMPYDQLAVFSCCRLSFVTAKGKVTPGIMHTFSGRKGGHKWEVKKPWTREAWTFSKGEKIWPPLRPSRFSLPALCPLPSARSRPSSLWLLQCPPLCSERTDHSPWPWSYIVMCTVLFIHRMFSPDFWRTGPRYVSKLVWKSPSSYTLSAGTSGQEWSQHQTPGSCEPPPLLLLLFLSLGQKTLRIFHNDFLDWMLGWSQQ